MTQTADQPMADLLDNLLCFDVYAVDLAFGRVYKPLLEPLGLTYPQMLVLTALWREDGVSVGAIGDLLSLETNTLTPLIKRMETRGLVRRERDKADERRVLVHLSERGEALRTEIEPALICAGEATGLTLEEGRKLQTMLRKLRNGLNTAARNAAE